MKKSFGLPKETHTSPYLICIKKTSLLVNGLIACFSFLFVSINVVIVVSFVFSVREYVVSYFYVFAHAQLASGPRDVFNKENCL